MNTRQFHKLPKKFYQKNVLEIARKLTGKYLVKKEGQKFLAGKIVEVEAYADKIDEASHSFRGITKRNQLMFATGGKMYVYFIYGNHFCCNVVCDKAGSGSAVLIRALEPLQGIEVMAERRFHKSEITEKEFLNLTNGPGKLCKAFNISKDENGIDLCGDDIFLTEGEKVLRKNILQSNRIGIKKSKELPWRFHLKDNPFVSAK
ncbi:MAG: 3-methyladenine DNA glycosylase [Ignavibacteria bacterium CG_4_8_14_3_um_filter_37_9]|nr:DNA-3-methyladenine glycosylase [Ignavibacteria bacterium]OIO16625.1 MAG: 3-methyladenine DNA glycosylase [Ignavibacteria bacterium CG1_02_37_35]PIP76207.1 MAG: 3-methyladenine DNA glycosylase [Ignavibacteria bacterium CG22_combo_CG10-13_8_21_14_all_37_15]PIS45527.1 MAG: 3-methyladenine DNA glycosylase [Ignavibacteria bacterium CG08_land_8_20_14_0_20_37_9]PIX00197.1 MAG: 3-methyladenine DNA glycosylase [Ignavibacteria bacterium CG_4_8_14_3_um_filter_37_9]PIX95322.1 MAG: 3-methyladenine DNA 